MRKRTGVSDDILGWIGLALGLAAAIILGKDSAAHKWHAAIQWTFVAFFGVLVFGREKRTSGAFWAFWAVSLGLHVGVMWFVFGYLFPRLILGTIYVFPAAIIESLFLTALFIAIERRLRRVSGVEFRKKTQKAR